MKKRKRGLYIAGLILFLIATLGPFLWAFVLSVTPEHAMMKKGAGLLPEKVIWNNYRILLDSEGQKGMLFRAGIRNSLKAIAVTAFVGLPVSVLSAWALGRMEFKGKTFINNCLLITMVIPIMATIIPIYRIFVTHDLLDRLFYLSLVYVSSYLPMLVWLMGNYFATIPKELEEAALVDGCSRRQCFFRIILPTSYPIILSGLLMIVLNTWSKFQIPLILTNSVAQKPVAIVVSEFVTKDTINYGITAAAGMLALVPPAVMACLFRKALVNGMMQGAVKG